MSQKTTINVAEAKRRFSEIVNQVVYHKKRFLIARRGKPMAGLVPVSEVVVGAPATPHKGFLPLTGLWKDVAHIDEMVSDIYKQRGKELQRPIPILDD